MSDLSSSFFDAGDAITRLKARVPDLVQVGGARDLGNATHETVRAPMAWVVVMSETAGPVRYESCGFIEVEVTARFGVILAVRDIADRTGTAARTALRPLRVAVQGAMCSWQPVGSNHACRFARGALTSGIGRDGMMFWQDEFTVGFDRRIIVEA